MKRHSKKINIKNISIGGDSFISVQSMLNVSSSDINNNIKQAILLEKSGCNILRIAVPNIDSVKNIDILKKHINIPIVADIHFDYKLAIESVYAGADKIRINPGNINDKNKIKLITKICNSKNIPIRIGVNSGSLEKSILEKYGEITPEALCESALYNINLLENFDFNNIIISLKSSNIKNTVLAYKLISNQCDYPLHIGLTEAGTENMGTIKSSIAIGALLLDGIGDTIRVSLTADPLKEVELGINILKSLNLYNNNYIDFVSCPTCGRTKIDIINIANQAEKLLFNYKKKLKIAIMGCIVNGPGEAKDADIGISGGDGVGVIFKKGKIFKRVEEKYLLKELVNEVNRMCELENV